MMRLSEPQVSHQETLDACGAGIVRNVGLRKKVEFSKPNLIAAGQDYLAAASGGELSLIEPIDDADDEDPTVVDSLKKSELIKIYDQYFVPEEKPARRIYERLLNAANEKCPFCGGIGTPRNLDHYLPKAHFPQFSVLPHNLVPACRDCNMDGKGHAFAHNAEDQIIQPYLDNDRFFQEQWIFATYRMGDHDEPGALEYFVVPPEGWSNVDKQRVNKHFVDFNLAKRYATKAAELLGTVIRQIATMRQAELNDETIDTVLLQPGIDTAPFVNHWQKGMFQALMQTAL